MNLLFKIILLQAILWIQTASADEEALEPIDREIPEVITNWETEPNAELREFCFFFSVISMKTTKKDSQTSNRDKKVIVIVIDY